jgi:hypothetical protein
LCAQVPVTSSRQVTVKKNVTRTELKTVTENRTMQVNETVTEVSFETVSVTVNATSARPADALMLLDASSSMLCYSCSGGKCAPRPRPRLRRDSPHIRAAPGRSHVRLQWALPWRRYTYWNLEKAAAISIADGMSKSLTDVQVSARALEDSLTSFRSQ